MQEIRWINYTQKLLRLWVNHSGNIDSDKVEIWRVLTDSIVLPSEAITIGEKLKAICQQESQLFTVNENPYYV